MRELPQGWVQVQVSTIAYVGTGSTPLKSTSNFYATSGIPWVTSAATSQVFITSANEYVTETAVAAHRLKTYPHGTLLVAMYGEGKTRGQVSELKIPATINQACAAIVVDEARALRRYVRFALQANYMVMRELAEGGNQPNLNLSKIKEFEIPLPPLVEQTRIANQLDTLLTRVQACNDRFDAIPALLKRFRQTVLDSATTGQLTDDWRTDKLGQVTAETVVAARLAVAGARPTKTASEFFESHQPVAPQKGTLPSTWLLTHIGMVGVVSNGSTPSRQEPSYWGSGIPWVSSGEVANGVIRHTREQITDSGFKNSSVRLLPQGSVLMAMIGEGKTRGQSAILDIDACINQNIAGVVPVDGILDSKYLWFWFRREYENTRTKGNGSGPKALNCERVRELEINLPPLPEQTAIVRRVEALFALADRIEARCTAARAQAQRLSPLVLAKAFRGELVPQDPNDEPASTLLARIASSNAIVAGENKRKVPAAPKKLALAAINL